MENSNTLPLVSFVIIYTNNKQLEECKKWIAQQDYKGKIESFIIDNRNNKSFDSAAKALNYGGNKSKGEIIFFMHQDIYLTDVKAVSNIVSYISNNKDSIVGAAGIALVDDQPHFDIEMKNKNKQYAWSTEGKPMEACTLDECLLAMDRKLWLKYKFDEVTCDNWHFYGADICLTNLLAGGKNIIFPLKIIHDSFGSPESEAFRNAAYKMVDKYQGKIETIHTTCLVSNCDPKSLKKYFRRRKFKLGLKRFLKKIKLYKLVELVRNPIKRKKGIFIVKEDD